MKKLILICLLIIASNAETVCYQYLEKSFRYVEIMEDNNVNNDRAELRRNLILFNIYIDGAIIECDNKMSDDSFKIKQDTNRRINKLLGNSK